jgi:hypothetical protein
MTPASAPRALRLECARLRLLDQAQVCAGTHTMAREFLGGHGEDAVGADDDFEAFPDRGSGCAHRSSVVL